MADDVRLLCRAKPLSGNVARRQNADAEIARRCDHAVEWHQTEPREPPLREPPLWPTRYTLNRLRKRKMVDLQRYVSNELSHFVGRCQPEEDQYQLLLRILRAGLLMHKPFNLAQQRTLRFNFSQPDEITDDVICFCDIPTSDLAIHVRKYSKFGLAFKKEFLIDKGACPVFYVANESLVPIGSDELFAPPGSAPSDQ
jgi:hypothetical protein